MESNDEASKINVILESFSRHADPVYHSQLLGISVEQYGAWWLALVKRQEEIEDAGFFGSVSAEQELRQQDVVELAKSTLKKEK